jgi:hypothetical protein
LHISEGKGKKSHVAFDEDMAEDNPEFMGDPEVHGLDEPRAGGFSIMQDLQEDLHDEHIASRSRRGTYTVRNLPAGAEVLQDRVVYPTDKAIGTAIKLGNGEIIWSDPWGYTRPFPKDEPFTASVTAGESLTKESLVEFLKKHREVSASDLKYAFGGTSQKHTAFLKGLVKDGTLVKDGSKYKLKKVAAEKKS